MMIEDKRYSLMFDEHTFFIKDKEQDRRLAPIFVTERLNCYEWLV